MGSIDLGVVERGDADDGGSHDEDAFSVSADSVDAGFEDVEFLGGVSVVLVVDVGIEEPEAVVGALFEGAEIEDGAGGIEDDPFSDEFRDGVVRLHAGRGEWTA